MSPSSNRIPSPALVVALIALLVTLSGVAFALPGKRAVGSGDVKRNAIRSQHVRGESLKGNDLADDAIQSKQVKPESLDTGDLREIEVADDSLVRVLASSGPDLGPARAGAPETVLYEEGELTLYGKCFHDAGAGSVHGEIYVRTSADGALLAGTDHLPANPGSALLNTETLEQDRRLDTEQVASAGEAAFDGAEGAAASVDGTSFRTLTTIGVKQGALPGPDGLFGEGNACLFGLDVIG